MIAAGRTARAAPLPACLADLAALPDNGTSSATLTVRSTGARGSSGSEDRRRCRSLRLRRFRSYGGRTGGQRQQADRQPNRLNTSGKVANVSPTDSNSIRAGESEDGSQAMLASKPMAPGLHLVATPIGNLGDITLRALAVLRIRRRIPCEDTRVTRKLLPRTDRQAADPYHDHNAAAMRPELLERLAPASGWRWFPTPARR